METTESKKWKMWKAILDIKTCRDCRKKHGKIYEIKEKVIPPPPLHWFCRCQIVRLRAIIAGNATKLGVMGADWWECLSKQKWTFTICLWTNMV